jgi:4-amino-4-deoxy-L-arabinose transferase-like glycosyltransferase
MQRMTPNETGGINGQALRPIDMASLAVAPSTHQAISSASLDGAMRADPRLSVGAQVLLLAIGQVVLWGAAAALLYSAPEIDGAEQFVWAFSMENGYWKHPPLPSWIMHGLIAVFGPSVALPFVAAQASIAIALVLTWRLACEFMAPRRALVAMVLTSLVAYHNIGGDAFNHSTALLPLQAATLLMFCRAMRHGRTWRWALFGLCAGLSMLVKYVALLPLAGMLLIFVLDRNQHRRPQVLGLALAVLIAALVLAPHGWWLHSNNFLPFRYAHSVARALPGTAATAASVADFALIQGLRLVPFLAGLWFVFAAAPRTAQRPSRAPVLSRNDALFLWIAALAPLTLTVLMALVTQTELQSRWGTNGFLVVGTLAVALLRDDSPRMARRAIGFAIVAHVVLCLSLTLSKTVVADRLDYRTRANFPGSQLAAHALATWREHTDAPLRVVVSDIWLGGNLIAHTPQRLAVLINGHHFKSPWIDAQTVEACGALVLDDQTIDAAGHDAPHAAISALMARATFSGVWALPWAHGSQRDVRGETGEVRWGIVLPSGNGHCPF